MLPEGSNPGQTSREAILGAMKVRIRFEPSHTSIEVPAGTTLLEAARRAGRPVATACGAEGVCARCGLEILTGGESLSEETPRERDVKQRNRIDSALRLSCYVDVRADLTVTAPYW